VSSALTGADLFGIDLEPGRSRTDRDLRPADPGAPAVGRGSPTKGFLKSVDVGPFQSAFHSMAGTWWANRLFMLGMLGVGVALLAGIGLRIAAASGTLIMALMWRRRSGAGVYGSSTSIGSWWPPSGVSAPGIAPFGSIMPS
jgi:hypothetical protein